MLCCGYAFLGLLFVSQAHGKRVTVQRLNKRLGVLESKVYLDSMSFRGDIESLYETLQNASQLEHVGCVDKGGSNKCCSSASEINLTNDKPGSHDQPDGRTAKIFSQQLVRAFTEEKTWLRSQVQALKLDVKEKMETVSKNLSNTTDILHQNKKDFTNNITKTVNAIKSSHARLNESLQDFIEFQSEQLTNLTETHRWLKASLHDVVNDNKVKSLTIENQSQQITDLKETHRKLNASLQDVVNDSKAKSLTIENQSQQIVKQSQQLTDLDQAHRRLNASLHGAIEDSKGKSLTTEALSQQLEISNQLLQFTAEYVLSRSKRVNHPEAIERSLTMFKQQLYSNIQDSLIVANGRTYYISREEASWEQAASKCMLYGGYLVEFYNMSDELQYLSRLLELPKMYWIGGTFNKRTGEWLWSHSKRKVVRISDWFTNPDFQCLWGGRNMFLKLKGDCSRNENYICQFDM